MAPIVTKGPSLECRQFTLEEYANVFEIPASPANKYEYSNRTWDPADSHHERSWFNGLQSLGEGKALFTNGWRAGADRLAKQVAKVTPPEAKTRRRKPRWSDDGDDLDCNRALRGELECWRTAKRVDVSGPSTVELFALLGGNCNISAEGLFWAGAACVVVADVLEQAGYSVKITAVWATRCWDYDRTMAMTMVTVKDYSDPFQLDALATVMCHSGTFRSNAFRAVNTFDVAHGSGYGYTQSYWESMGEPLESFKASSLWPDGAILVNAPSSQSGCEAEIRRILAMLQPA